MSEQMPGSSLILTRLSSHQPLRQAADVAAVLATVGLFADLAPEELHALAATARRRAAKRGALLLSQDEIGETAFILLSGAVDIVADSSDGREFLLARVEPGEIFGEMALLDGEPRSASAVAHQDSDVLVLARRDLLAHLEQHPRVMLRLMQSLSRRLRRANERLNAFAFRDVTTRLAAALLLLDEHGGSGTINMDQQQLADQVGAARQTVSRILNDWRREGWVDLHRGQIRVLDGMQLRQLIA